MADVGIKISRPTYDARTASPEELSFSSAYKTLKIHDRGGGTLTQSSKTATIPHNLGYVPFFLVHTQLDPSVASNSLVGDNTDFFISPFRLGTAVEVWESEASHDIVAYADSTNLYVKAKSNAGKYLYPAHVPGSTNANENLAIEWQGGGGGNDVGYWGLGNSSGFFDVVYGAWRFRNIDLDKDDTVYSATLQMYVNFQESSGEIRSNVWGIDEDNTGVFNSGTVATARAKTTAATTHNFTASQGSFAGANVKYQVEEIVARSGWSNGNAMGFMAWNDGSADGKWIGEDSSDGQTYLEIIKSSDIIDYKYTIFLNQLE